jgi:hypothetical protein
VSGTTPPRSVRDFTQYIEQEKLELKGENTNRASSPFSKSQIDAAFDLFWRAYPKGVGEKAAREAYGRALKKITAPELLKATQSYATEVQGREARFIAQASNWLTGERWRDAPSTPPGGAPPPRAYSRWAI